MLFSGRLNLYLNNKQSCCKTVLWGRNLFEKRFSSPPCPAIASATAEPHFPKTFTGIAFITSNKSNSNLFYIKEIQRFTCNNFYCCCINSRLLIFSTANKNLYKKNRGFATFYEVLQQPHLFLS